MDDTIPNPQFETGEGGPTMRETIREYPKTPSGAKGAVASAVQKFTDDSVKKTQSMNTTIGASDDDAGPIIDAATEEVQSILEEAKQLQMTTEQKINQLGSTRTSDSVQNAEDSEMPSILKFMTTSTGSAKPKQSGPIADTVPETKNNSQPASKKETQKPEQGINKKPKPSGILAAITKGPIEEKKEIHHVVPGADSEPEIHLNEEDEPELLVVSPADHGQPITSEESSATTYGGHLG